MEEDSPLVGGNINTNINININIMEINLHKK